jgi:anti-sigma B factor antagonist
MGFKVKIETIEGVDTLSVAVEGELDLATADEVREANAVAARVRYPLVLDLSECYFIDSSGLRSVIHVDGAVAAVDEAMVIVTVSPQVRKMLALTGIDGHVRVFPTRADALVWLEGEDVTAPLAGEASSPTPSNGRPSSASLLP